MHFQVTRRDQDASRGRFGFAAPRITAHGASQRCVPQDAARRAAWCRARPRRLKGGDRRCGSAVLVRAFFEAGGDEQFRMFVSIVSCSSGIPDALVLGAICGGSAAETSLRACVPLRA
eukprot:1401890-Alexandrium_andersonii.AAC.1